MPIRHEGSLLKNGITCFLRSRCTRAELPFSSTPCTWKTLFARSSPIVMILIADAPFLVLSPASIRMIVDGWCRGVHMINVCAGEGRPACMTRAYSEDLRRRVIGAVEAGASCRQAAQRYEIGESTAIRWLARWRSTG